jgi:hypothetical protein
MAALVALVIGCGGGGGAAGICRPGQRCASDAGADGGPPSPDSASTLACGAVQPCGGDVVGDWTFVEECDSPADLASIQANFADSVDSTWCAVAKLVGIEPQASGSLQFDAAGDYSLDLTFGGYFDINYPATCLVGFNCDDLTTELQSEIDAGVFIIATASSISCSGTTSCRCRAGVSATQSQTGTYSVSGNVVTFDATTGAVLEKSFCVAGNTLHVLGTSTGSSGQTSIDSDVVAVKP